MIAVVSTISKGQVSASTIAIDVALAKSNFSVCAVDPAGHVRGLGDQDREALTLWLAQLSAPAAWWRWRRAVTRISSARIERGCSGGFGSSPLPVGTLIVGPRRHPGDPWYAGFLFFLRVALRWGGYTDPTHKPR